MKLTFVETLVAPEIAACHYTNEKGEHLIAMIGGDEPRELHVFDTKEQARGYFDSERVRLGAAT